MTHAIAKHFLNQEISVFGKSDVDDCPNCLGGGFLIAIEDGFMILSEEKGKLADMAVALSAIEVVATVREDDSGKFQGNN